MVRGDKLPYSEDPGSSVANLLETKLLLDIVISDAAIDARFMSIDLKDHFLFSPMDKPEYMTIHCKYLPLHIMHY